MCRNSICGGSYAPKTRTRSRCWNAIATFWSPTASRSARSAMRRDFTILSRMESPVRSRVKSTRSSKRHSRTAEPGRRSKPATARAWMKWMVFRSTASRAISTGETSGCCASWRPRMRASGLASSSSSPPRSVRCIGGSRTRPAVRTSCPARACSTRRQPARRS